MDQKDINDDLYQELEKVMDERRAGNPERFNKLLQILREINQGVDARAA